jgi:apoptosis-stimulating of p53 protein 1
LCVSAASDLDSIRALFNEKEKELSLAVAKVEELTRQLEELKRGRGASAREQQQQAPSPAALELDKLRRELMVCFDIQETHYCVQGTASFQHGCEWCVTDFM